jgi:hypothetical protein
VVPRTFPVIVSFTPHLPDSSKVKSNANVVAQLQVPQIRCWISVLNWKGKVERLRPVKTPWQLAFEGTLHCYAPTCLSFAIDSGSRNLRSSAKNTVVLNAARPLMCVRFRFTPAYFLSHSITVRKPTSDSAFESYPQF